MNPESYGYYAQPPAPNANRRKIILLLILAVAVVLIVTVLALLNKPPSSKGANSSNAPVSGTSYQSGTMEVTINNLPDQNGLVVSLNQKPLTNVSPDSTGAFSEELSGGTYTLQVNKPGYKAFSAQFSITPSQTTLINVNPQPIADTTITNWSQVHASDPVQFDDAPTGSGTSPSPAVSIVNVQYFYNKTWAFLTVNDGSAYGYEVAQYNFQTNSWVGIAGTSQYFSNYYVNEMPSLVQGYLQANNHTYPEG